MLHCTLLHCAALPCIATIKHQSAAPPSQLLAAAARLKDSLLANMSDDDETEFAQKECRRLAKDKARLAPLVIRPGQLGQPGQEGGQQPGGCTVPPA